MNDIVCEAQSPCALVSGHHALKGGINHGDFASLQCLNFVGVTVITDHAAASFSTVSPNDKPDVVCSHDGDIQKKLPQIFSVVEMLLRECEMLVTQGPFYTWGNMTNSS